MNELNTDMCKWNDLRLSAFCLLCHWEQGLVTLKVLDLLAELRACVPATHHFLLIKQRNASLPCFPTSFDSMKLDIKSYCPIAKISTPIQHRTGSPSRSHQPRVEIECIQIRKERGLFLMMIWSYTDKVFKIPPKNIELQSLECRTNKQVSGCKIHTRPHPWNSRPPGTPSPRTCSRCAPFPGRWTGASSLTGSGQSTLQPAPRWTWQPAEAKGAAVGAFSF